MEMICAVTHIDLIDKEDLAISAEAISGVSCNPYADDAPSGFNVRLGDLTIALPTQAAMELVLVLADATGFVVTDPEPTEGEY
ncbi:MAG: hypothetical protein RLY58_2425 [Pseudomonadota bacterium]|jgi:hypothetical protein